jgi:hypothetical protein
VMGKRKSNEQFEIMCDMIRLFGEYDCTPAVAMLVCVQTLCVIAARDGKDFRDIPAIVDMVVGRLDRDVDWRELLTGMGEAMSMN